MSFGPTIHEFHLGRAAIRQIDAASEEADAAIAKLNRERAAAKANSDKLLKLLSERDEYIRELQAANAKLVADRKTDACVIAGQKAYIREVQILSPDCEALAASGDKFDDGKDISIAGKAYAQAYDAQKRKTANA